MDPNACLDLVVSAVEKEDFSAALDHFRDLGEWRAKGGFAPTWTAARRKAVDALKKKVPAARKIHV